MADDLVQRIKAKRAALDHELEADLVKLLADAADRIEALEERLEINHAYQLVDGKMVRVEADMSECDGIMARDETIRLLKQELAKQRDRIEALEAALRGCLAVIRRDYYDQRAAALEGHIIAYDARKEWDQSWAALCEQPPEAP